MLRQKFGVYTFEERTGGVTDPAAMKLPHRSVVC